MHRLICFVVQLIFPTEHETNHETAKQLVITTCFLAFSVPFRLDTSCSLLQPTPHSFFPLFLLLCNIRYFTSYYNEFKRKRGLFRENSLKAKFFSQEKSKKLRSQAKNHREGK